MTELVNNINNEAGGVIKAELNSDGKLVLSNHTGAFISVEDDSSSVGSGFSGHTNAVQHNGFLKIESNDGSNIRVERGNTALSSPGALSDLQAFGLNETINTTASDGYTVVGEALKSKTTHLVTREITRGKTGTNEIQHVVGIDATTLADMANSTVSLNDGNGQTVTVDFTNAPADIDALRDAITAKITSHDGVAGNTDFGLAITDGLSGTDLVMTFDLAGQTAAQNVTMASFSYTKTASGLETSIAKGDLTLNGVEIFNTDIASNSFGGKLNLINSFSAETGVVASATFDQTFVVDPNNIIKGDVVKINGTEVEVTASNDIAALITALNARTDSTGLTASRSGNNITFKGENVQSLTIGQMSKTEISDTLVSASMTIRYYHCRPYAHN